MTSSCNPLNEREGLLFWVSKVTWTPTIMRLNRSSIRTLKASLPFIAHVHAVIRILIGGVGIGLAQAIGFFHRAIKPRIRFVAWAAAAGMVAFKIGTEAGFIF
ncbi:hypothetical protein BFS14_07575 [Serratia fonticola]|nr:hypothetical protein BFS14_07575 [Serratia fonticola]